jgi:polar amino acid transport system permease protein
MIDWPFLTDHLLPALNQGLMMSVALIIPSAVIGLLLGIVTGALRAFGHAPVRRAANIYAAIFRGTPLVVQLFIIYFGLPNVGIYFSPYAAAVIGFILCSGAYHSEYIRGGLMSIKRGQIQAAQSLGFSTTGALIWIIIPQALRRALPGCGNELIYLIKYSSLAYIITCIELTGQARDVATTYFRFTESFFMAGLYYLALVTLATIGLRLLEKRMYIPGFGKQQ